MSTTDRTRTRQITPSNDAIYRSSDGKPMSDNTRQFQWIMTLQGGIDSLFADRDDVWVAGDCLWYPVEGEPKIRIAPDTMVVFGRPRGHRGSYIPHREEGVAVAVAFEVLWPKNSPTEMRRKLAFDETYGVEEYDVVDPDRGRHLGYLRTTSGVLEPIAELFGWVSPRLGIRFELATGRKPGLRILRSEDRPLESCKKIARHLDDSERLIIAERLRADNERTRAEAERTRVERLLTQLRALGIEPEA